MNVQNATLKQAGYFTPASVAEALDAARRTERDFKYVAGGTDVMPLKQQKLIAECAMIDLSGILELRSLHSSKAGLEIGSLVTLDQLVKSGEINRDYPILAAAAASIASPVLRKSATVGGNLLVDNRCTFYNQSHFWRDSIGSCLRDTGDKCLVTGIVGGKCFARGVSDLLPALIALAAHVEVQDYELKWNSPLEELFVQDGLRPVPNLKAESIIQSLRIPAPVRRWYFRKLRTRRSMDFTSLTVAAVKDMNDSVRICLNGIAMAPLLISGKLTELSLEQIIHQTRLKSKIVDNDLLPLGCRKNMMDVFLREAWDAVCL